MGQRTAPRAQPRARSPQASAGCRPLSAWPAQRRQATERYKGPPAWHFGRGPEYCRGCAALGRDCADACPYAAHAPATAEGAAAWAAGTACATATMAGLDLDMAGALAAAREMGTSGWAAAELLTALRLGMAAGAATRRTPTPDAGGLPHGG